MPHINERPTDRQKAETFLSMLPMARKIGNIATENFLAKYKSLGISNTELSKDVSTRTLEFIFASAVSADVVTAAHHPDDMEVFLSSVDDDSSKLSGPVHRELSNTADQAFLAVARKQVGGVYAANEVQAVALSAGVIGVRLLELTNRHEIQPEQLRQRYMRDVYLAAISAPVSNS